MVALNQVQKRPKFVEFAKLRSKANPIHVISALLIQPIQRIPRYEMLLKDLVKSTWQSHDDLDALEIALDKIVGAATFINDQKRKTETLARLLEIQTEVGDLIEIYETGREIVSEGLVALPKKRKGKNQ